MSWEEQSDGTFLGVATERAVEWANGSHKQLACIGFVAFCRDMGLAPSWLPNTPDQVHLPGGGAWEITILHDQSTVPDLFNIDPSRIERLKTYAGVRILAGSMPLIHILGVSGTLDQRDPGPWPIGLAFQPVRWFLSAFQNGANHADASDQGGTRTRNARAVEHAAQPRESVAVD